MKPHLILAVLLTHISPTAANALEFAGTWQTPEPRYVMTITKLPGSNRYTGQWYNLGDIEGMLNGNPLVVTIQGNKIELNPVRTPGTFEGALSADGKTIKGDWGAHDPDPLTFERPTPATAHPIDPSPHKTSFVTVKPGVKLEVLDWGGNGPPLVFLAGLGRTGHSFDSLALKFTGTHHVYAITRRGFGLSSYPPATDENYDSDRLGDDVLAVMQTLNLHRPVLAGHSIAGQELSSIGTRHPEKVAGLVYLDSAGAYAFYDPGILSDDSFEVSRDIIRRDLARLPTAPPSQARVPTEEIQMALPNLQEGMQSQLTALASRADPQPHERRSADLVSSAIRANARIYTGIKAPILVLAAVPPGCLPDCQAYAKLNASQANFVEANYPDARIVRLAGADHFVWRTNEADVIREMNAFMDGLPKP